MSNIGSGGWTPSLVTVSDGVSPDASFLASEHGLNKRAGATIDASTLTADAKGNKIVKAGTLIAKITANGKYGLYDALATDGRETITDDAGFLPESINARNGDVITGVLLHGSVLTARVIGVDAAAKTALKGRIIFQ